MAGEDGRGVNVRPEFHPRGMKSSRKYAAEQPRGLPLLRDASRSSSPEKSKLVNLVGARGLTAGQP